MILVVPIIYDYIRTRRHVPSNATQNVYTRIVKHKRRMMEFLDSYETRFIKQAKPVFKRFEVAGERGSSPQHEPHTRLSSAEEVKEDS